MRRLEKAHRVELQQSERDSCAGRQAPLVACDIKSLTSSAAAAAALPEELRPFESSPDNAVQLYKVVLVVVVVPLQQVAAAVCAGQHTQHSQAAEADVAQQETTKLRLSM